MASAYDITVSPSKTTPTNDKTNVGLYATSKNSAFKKKVGFQLYLLQERGNFGAKYPFLTAQQIKSKVADSWAKLSGAEKDKYKPCHPSPRTPKCKKNLTKKVSSFRSPGHALKTPRASKFSVDYTPPRLLKDPSKLHPVALRNALLITSKKQIFKPDTSVSEKTPDCDLYSDESITLQMSQESRHYGSGNHTATKINYRAPEVVENKPSTPKTSILRARDNDCQTKNEGKEEVITKTSGRVSFGENKEKLIERTSLVSPGSDSDPSFSPPVNDGPANWIMEHRLKVKGGKKRINPTPPPKSYRRIREDPFTFGSSTDSDLMSEDFLEYSDEVKEKALPESESDDDDDEREGQLLTRHEEFEEENATVQSREDEDREMEELTVKENGNEIREPCAKRDEYWIEKETGKTNETKDIIREAQELIKKCMEETNEDKFKTPATNSSITKYLIKSKQSGRVDLNKTTGEKYTNILDSATKFKDTMTENDDITPQMPITILKEKLKSALKQPRKRKRSEMIEDNDDNKETKPSSAKKCIIAKQNVHCPRTRNSHKKYKSILVQGVEEKNKSDKDLDCEDEIIPGNLHIKSDKRQSTLDNFFERKTSIKETKYDVMKTINKVNSINEHENRTDKLACISPVEEECLSSKVEENKDNKAEKSTSQTFVKPAPKKTKVQKCQQKVLPPSPKSKSNNADGIFKSLTGSDLLFDTESPQDAPPLMKPPKSNVVVDRTIMLLRELGSPQVPDWSDDENSRLSSEGVMSPAVSGISRLSHATSLDDVEESNIFSFAELQEIQTEEKIDAAKVISTKMMYGKKDAKAKTLNKSTEDTSISEMTISPDKMVNGNEILQEPLKADPLKALDTKPGTSKMGEASGTTVEQKSRAMVVLDNIPTERSPSQTESTVDRSPELPDVIPSDGKRSKPPKSYSKYNKYGRLIDLFDEISPRDKEKKGSGTKRRLVQSLAEKENSLEDLFDDNQFFA